jgi:hypothetical protein
MVNHEGHIFHIIITETFNRKSASITYAGKGKDYTPSGILLAKVPNIIKPIFFRLNRKDILTLLGKENQGIPYPPK